MNRGTRRGFFVVGPDGNDDVAAVSRWLRCRFPEAVVASRPELDTDPADWMAQHGTDLVICGGWETSSDSGARYRHALTNEWPVWRAAPSGDSLTLVPLRQGSDR